MVRLPSCRHIYEKVVYMEWVSLEELDLLDIGNNIHLKASLWVDSRTGIAYLMPVDSDFELKEDDIKIIKTDDIGRIKFIRQSDVVETRLYEGPKKLHVKGIIKKSESTLHPKLVWEVFRRDNFTCVYCGRNSGPMTFDHYLPRCFGGATSVENGRTSCRRCNMLKANLSPEEWLESKEYRRVSHGYKCK